MAISTNTSVLTLGLSLRVANALRRHGVKTLDELAATPVAELETIYGIGPNAVHEIIELLQSLGYSDTQSNGNIDTANTVPDISKDAHSLSSPKTNVMEISSLSIRTRRRLYRSGIHTVADLLATTREILATYAGLREVSLQEVDQLLEWINTSYSVNLK